MALTDKLVAIGDAIRNKTNTTDVMTLDEMPSKIENIVNEANPILQDKTVEITTNGTTNIVVDEGYDGLGNVAVTVEVEPNLQDKSITITENGTQTIKHDEGYDGLGEVNLDLKVGTNIAWVIKDGVEQTDFTGGSEFYWVTGENKPGYKSEVTGAIHLCAKIWSVYRLKFNNKIDLTKFSRAYIECDYLTTSAPYANQNAGLDVQLLDTNFSSSVKSGSTMSRRIIEVNLESDLEEDNLSLAVYNSYDSSTRHGFNVYNLWLEGENKANLQDKEIEITSNGKTSIVADEEYDGLGKVTIKTNVEGGNPIPHTELEYIETYGYAWFETNFKLGSDSRVKAKFSRDITFGDGGALLGVYEDSGNRFMFGFATNGRNHNRFDWYYGGQTGLQETVDGKNDFIVDLNKNVWTVYDFEGIQLTTKTFTSVHFTNFYTTAILGAKVRQAAVNQVGYQKLYYFQIYENDILIHDFIPVNKDGKGCLYDKVNNSYLYGVGDEEIVMGPEL